VARAEAKAAAVVNKVAAEVAKAVAAAVAAAVPVVEAVRAAAAVAVARVVAPVAVAAAANPADADTNRFRDLAHSTGKIKGFNESRICSLKTGVALMRREKAVRREIEPGGMRRASLVAQLALLNLEQRENMSMKEEAEREELRFKVECTWCGSLIRRTSVKDSHGMCLKCYSRMLGEHGHAYERENTLRWARGSRSER
jgi:hypothetical protein